MSTVEQKVFAMECDAPGGCSAEVDASDGVLLFGTPEQARAQAWWADWSTDGNGKDYCPHHRDLAAVRVPVGEGEQ